MLGGEAVMGIGNGLALPGSVGMAKGPLPEVGYGLAPLLHGDSLSPTELKKSSEYLLAALLSLE